MRLCRSVAADACLASLWLLLAPACEFKTGAVPGSTAVSAGDEEGDGLAKRMPEGAAIEASPAGAAAAEQARDFRPQLAELPSADGQTDDPEAAQADATRWGAPDTESGEAGPARSKIKKAARTAIAEGVAAAGKPDYAAAEAAFERALQLDPRAYTAAYDLGIVAERQGNSERALAAYERALKLQPDYEDAVEAQAHIHLRRGDRDRALAAVQPLAQKWPRNLALQAILANILIALERLDEAEVVARAALSRDERYVPVMVPLASIAMLRGHFELADSILEQASAIDAKNADVHFLLARRHQQEGRLAPAVAEYRRAVELRPEFCEARMALGLQYMAAGNYAEALTQFEVLAQLAPDSAQVRLNLGDALRANRRWKDGKRVLGKVRDDDKLVAAHYDLGLLYLDAGNEISGLTLLETLERAQEEFTAYRAVMGTSLPKDDASGTHLADVQRLLERERKRIEREAARKPTGEGAK